MLGGLLQSDGLKGVVHPAVGQVPNLLHHPAAGSVNNVGSPEVPGHGQLGFHRVDGDDPQSPGQSRPLNTIETHAAAAHHGHGAARLHPGGIQYRAQAGGGTAPDQGQPVERHVFAHLDQGMLVDQHLLGIGTKLGELSQGGGSLPQSGRLVGAAYHVGAGTEDGLAPQAEFAVSAKDGKTGNYRISPLDVGYLIAHRLHRSGGFVAQDSRHLDTVFTLDKVEVAVTDPAGPSANQHLPRAGGIHLHLFHFQG